MNNIVYKLNKGDSFNHFYYAALTTDTSRELKEFIDLNKWYFNKMNDDVKSQLRGIYAYRTSRENKSIESLQ